MNYYVATFVATFVVIFIWSRNRTLSASQYFVITVNRDNFSKSYIKKGFIAKYVRKIILANKKVLAYCAQKN